MKFHPLLAALTALAANPLLAADPAPAPTPPLETVTLATGCFWCTEVILQRTKGVLSATSGYTNGKTPNPTYDDVCTGLTGHAEAVEVVFDPAGLPFETLTRVFFEMHDLDDFQYALRKSQEPFSFRKVVLNVDFPDRLKEHDQKTQKDYEMFEAPLI